MCIYVTCVVFYVCYVHVWCACGIYLCICEVRCVCVCAWCICMCVLRGMVDGGKSVSNEYDLESPYSPPQETTGVFCWDPQSHTSQGMGTPSDQAKFLPLLLSPRGSWDFPEVERRKVKGNEALLQGGQHSSRILSPCYRHRSGSCCELVGLPGLTFPPSVLSLG